MKRLNYQVLKECGYPGYVLERGPEKVLQFGEGNFLRAFADCWFDLANERVGWNGKCVLVQPIPQGLAEPINAQQGLYTLCLRGREGGEAVDRRRVISAVSRCLNPYERSDYQAMLAVAASPELEYIVSNTTEAGIVYDPACRLEDEPPAAFPAKLTQVLYHRWQAGQPGLVILSCELIDQNGRVLQDCVERYAGQWGLEEGFRDWLKGCTFCSTLVDRIVPGRIRDREERERLEARLGYADPLLDVGEVFGVWVIQGPEWLADKLPGVLVIHGDGTDQHLLEAEGILDSDAFVALTNRDEENLLMALSVQRRGVRKVIAKMSRLNYIELMRDAGVDSIISPKDTASSVPRISPPARSPPTSALWPTAGAALWSISTSCWMGPWRRSCSPPPPPPGFWTRP